MAKKDIEQLSRRIEFLEMQIKELKTVDPGVVNEKLKSLEDAIYTTKEILNMKDVCQYPVSYTHLTLPTTRSV